MYANLQAKTAYGHSTSALRGSKETEYEVLAKVTQKLVASKNTPSNFSDQLEALTLNERLWTILAKDVASDENALPAALRAQIFYLYEFSIHHSNEVRAGSATVDALIEVNTAIMRGLAHREGPAA